MKLSAEERRKLYEKAKPGAEVRVETSKKLTEKQSQTVLVVVAVVWCILFAFAAIYLLIVHFGSNETIKSPPVETKDPAEIQAEREIGPKPISSTWDGSVECVKEYFEKNLNDPDSVKYDEWSKVILMNLAGKKFWAVRVKYRARNLFGGYVLKNEVAYIRNNQVAFLLDYQR